MFGSSTFIFQSVKEGMSVCQCIVYIGGFVGSQRQKLVESQNRFTTDIFLFKNPCMIFEVSTGSYTPADVCQRVRSSDEFKFAASGKFLFDCYDIYFLSVAIHTL